MASAMTCLKESQKKDRTNHRGTETQRKPENEFFKTLSSPAFLCVSVPLWLVLSLFSFFAFRPTSEQLTPFQFRQLRLRVQRAVDDEVGHVLHHPLEVFRCERVHVHV